MSMCPECGERPPPAGYYACRSCTFGRDSTEGRIERMWDAGSGLSVSERFAGEAALTGCETMAKLAKKAKESNS